jgi:hypothetical protein
LFLAACALLCLAIQRGILFFESYLPLTGWTLAVALAGTTMFCAVVTDTLSTLPLCQTISNLLPALPSIPLPVCLPGCLNGGELP